MSQVLRRAAVAALCLWVGFALAMALTAWGLVRMDINPSYKAFLGVAWLFLISSAFTLALSNNTTQAVKWNDQTTFQGVTSSTLAGTQIQVEGYLDASSVLIAREIRVPGQREADRFDNQGGGDWDRYDKEFRPAKRGNQN